MPATVHFRTLPAGRTGWRRHWHCLIPRPGCPWREIQRQENQRRGLLQMRQRFRKPGMPQRFRGSLHPHWKRPVRAKSSWRAWEPWALSVPWELQAYGWELLPHGQPHGPEFQRVP